MNIKLGPPKISDLKPRITVVGIGGAGCNAINNMIATQLDGVEFVVANTDAQSLNMSNAEHRIQLGANLTEGLGAGARPEVGEAAAREADEAIRAEIAGSHMVFIAAGMGGGTGTGAASVVAEIARDLGILTVGIVSKPFQFEGARRMRTAEAGIEKLEKAIDTLIVIPNQNLFRIANERTTFAEAFRLADQVLYSGIACIVDLIVKEGLINLDFADVQAVMKGMGTAMMGTGEATGEDRALTAANEAIANPLLDNLTLSGAQGLLISIVGGNDLTLYEVDTAASHIRKEVAPEANIIVGATTEAGMDEHIRVSIVASGISGTISDAHNTPTSAAAPAPAAPTTPPVASLPEAVAGPALIQHTAEAHPESTELTDKMPDTQTGARDAAAEHIEPDRTSPQNVGSSSSELEAREADEFARALSEAMEASEQETDKGDFAQDRWRSADGVTVEEGFATARSSSQQPPPLPARVEATPTTNSASFEPTPPSEVRRASSRMPDMSEFPEVAQREYFAKMEAAKQANDVRRQFSDQAESSSSPTEQHTQHENSPQAQTQPKSAAMISDRSATRPGLLRRLTGGARK
ncbi:MAG: cell division protein FtsZ [Hyphomicrobiaceae bacterium]